MSISMRTMREPTATSNPVPMCHDRGERHRHRNSGGDPGSRVRALLHPKDVRKGTGLGLSMVNGFAKQSGGHIKIYSEEGHGTTIKLYLPGARELDATDVAPGSPIEGGHETILVVEDDPPVRALVTTQLESLGYTVLAASNGGRP